MVFMTRGQTERFISKQEETQELLRESIEQSKELIAQSERLIDAQREHPVSRPFIAR
jgi:hypothetical protein